MKIIDPHLHLFDLTKGDYHWLKAENAPFWPDKKLISRNFAPSDLTLDLPNELAGFVHIEAGFNNESPEQELNWLANDIEPECNIALKTIASIDLTDSPDKNKQLLHSLSQFKSFVGVRHILDDEAGTILSHENCQPNFALLAQLETKPELVFEVQLPLVVENNANPALTRLTKLMAQFPTLSFVIGHSGFAPLADKKGNKQKLHGQERVQANAPVSTWKDALATLATLDNCAIKCSGWEMIDRNYSLEAVTQIIDKALHAFGENRVMLASNFPLTLFSHSYQALWQHYSQLDYTAEQLNKMLYQNAHRIYQFDER